MQKKHIHTAITLHTHYTHSKYNIDYNINTKNTHKSKS